jgi:hypothetical protein
MAPFRNQAKAKRVMNTCKLSLILLSTLISTSAPSEPAIGLASGWQVIGTSGTLGWRFRVTSATGIQVYALGALTPASNPHTNTIAIWNISGGEPIVTAQMFPGTGTFEQEQFTYVNIPPVTLLADTEYVIGCGATVQPYFIDVQGLTNSTSVQYLSARVGPAPGGVPTFPQPSEAAASFFGPNFQYVPLPLASIRVSGVDVCWTTESNKNYQVEYRSALTTNTWTYLAGPIVGTGTNNCVSDAVHPGEPQRFYRIVGLPAL